MQKSISLSTRLSLEVVEELQRLADSIGTSPHRLCAAAIEVGLPIAPYKVQIDRIKKDRNHQQVEAVRLSWEQTN